MNQKIQVFNEENISQIVEFVKPMWTFSDWNDFFRNLYAERIVRNNFFQNGMAFQIQENQKLSAAVFFQKKSDVNNVKEWILEKSQNLSFEEKNSLKICQDYLDFMDSKIHALMNEEDIKLSLFVALQKGSGKILFDELWEFLKPSDYKNMYLWTDCDCNWQWYIKNGFTLEEEGVYEKFSSESEKYKTYIFKKEIKKG